MANLILWNSYDGSDLTSHSFVRPLGCHQIANWLSNFGYTVKVIDFCSILTPDQVIHLTEKNIDKDTIAIGLSTTFTKKVIPTWAEFAKNYIERSYSTYKYSMIHVKNFIEKVSLLESKRTKDLVMPMTDARGLRDEIASILIDLQEYNSKCKSDDQVLQVEIKGGTFK